VPRESAAAVHSQLVVVRHGESTNNVVERFTGWRDVELTARGREQARAAGQVLAARGVAFAAVFTSMLRRAIESADLMLLACGQTGVPRRADWRLNERHFGALQGMTKQESSAAFGAEQARHFRRAWDTPPPPAPAGSADDPRTDARYAAWRDELPLAECFRDLVGRVERWWHAELRPVLARGAAVLVVGHGQALRALGRAVEDSRAPALPSWRLQSARPRWYRLDARLQVLDVEDLGTGGGSDAPEE